MEISATLWARVAWGGLYIFYSFCMICIVCELSWRVCQALTLVALGRVDDAIQTLRVIIEQDIPDQVRRHGEVLQEVVSQYRMSLVAS